jgi:hypothetical protein
MHGEAVADIGEDLERIVEILRYSNVINRNQGIYLINRIASLNI